MPLLGKSSPEISGGGFIPKESLWEEGLYYTFILKEAIATTNFDFPNQTNFYKGKVRDVYTIGEKLVMVASDRISAFDHVLNRPIPYKGQVLNQIAAYFLDATKDIVPNWVIATPDPNVTIGVACEPFKVEMVIRGYLSGHAWRLYNAGTKEICGVTMPDSLQESDKLPQPIITPTTKAAFGHDEDISRENILAQGIASEEDYVLLEKYTYDLFERGTQMAAAQGLILVDTKYEFGKKDGKIILIDEIHTPDSSRYFVAEGFSEKQAKGERQIQLSKEFVREWLMANGFQGLEGESQPDMPDEFVWEISNRYIQLYEKVTGKSFEKADVENIMDRIESNILDALY